jgi:predicted ATPase
MQHLNDFSPVTPMTVFSGDNNSFKSCVVVNHDELLVMSTIWKLPSFLSPTGVLP